MKTPVHPQEIYLLERYTSLNYFGTLRDVWLEMITHVETCLNNFVHNLPPDYRKRPLPEQPDIVWGERVLPNFRNTFQDLCEGFIKVSHGEIDGLNYAHGPVNDFKGQMEFWAGWMQSADEDRYRQLLSAATTMAGNISSTEGALWDPGDLTERAEKRGPIDPPASWPTYRVNPNVAIPSGERAKHAGIYVPDIDNSCAQYLSTEYPETPLASVFIGMNEILHPVTGVKYAEEPMFQTRPCLWRLVERLTDENMAAAPAMLSHEAHRVVGGQLCPAAGHYFTPAVQNSRRMFKKGDVMPNFDGAYGATIWQWDCDQ